MRTTGIGFAPAASQEAAGLDRVVYLLYRLTLLLSRYRRAFGPVRGPSLLLAAILFPPLRGRPFTPRKAPVPLEVRIGTSDVEVYVKIFLMREYDLELPVTPRTIVDAGAYTGLSTVWFALKWPNATIIAVEPHPANFRFLTANTRRFPRIHTIRAALWKQNTQLSLADPRRGFWGFQVRDRSGPLGPEVDALTVDKLMSLYDLDRINLLKIDIEGAERELFARPEGWINRVDTIVAELHDDLAPGSSRAFYEAVAQFPGEARMGETVVVSRAGSGQA